jgi:hypothetical protein
MGEIRARYSGPGNFCRNNETCRAGKTSSASSGTTSAGGKSRHVIERSAIEPGKGRCIAKNANRRTEPG